MNRVFWIILLATLALPAGSAAQSSVSGSAEVTVAQSENMTDSHANSNGEFWQNYSIGLHSSLLDPRILKYDTEVMFRTNRLSAAGSNLADQYGHQDDLGFRVGVFAFPSGSFPFFVQASRVFTGSTGELTMSNSGLAGIPVQPGGSLAAFDKEDRDLNLGGQLNVPGLPRAEVSYRRGDSITTGGTERAEQLNDDLSASLTRETTRTRQALRYQRSGYDYVLAQAFSQRIENLDYDFATTVRKHFQLTARAGQRGTFAVSSLLVQPISPSDQPYAPPPATDGRSNADYVTGGVSYEPNARVSVRLNGTWDQQQSSIAATDNALATGTVHAEVVRGLAVNVAGTSGQRGQFIDGVVKQVATSNGVVGATYTGGPRWLNGTITASTGQGTNETPEGERGRTRSWAREGSLSSSIKFFSVGAGYERVLSEDAILDYGNYDSERSRASASMQSSRLSLTGSADRLLITRGLGVTFVRNRQDTFSASLSGRVWHDLTVTGLAGGFTTTYQNVTGNGVDRSVFWSVGAQSTMRRSLRAMAWIRSEDTLATSTRFNQTGLSSFARLEYRLRALNFGVEYRHNDSQLLYGTAPTPTLFRGHQIRFSLTRQFGFGI